MDMISLGGYDILGVVVSWGVCFLVTVVVAQERGLVLVLVDTLTANATASSYNDSIMTQAAP